MLSNKELLWVYRAPKIVYWFRIVLSIIIVALNPLKLPLVWLQLVVMCVYIVALISYHLFKNSVPIFPVFLSMGVHYVLSGLIYKTWGIIGFIPLVVVDLICLAVASIRALMFPFVIGDKKPELTSVEE